MKKLGFTLIELIIVIVILGVLVLIAAPKFITLQSDARKASLEATKGVIESSFQIFFTKAQLPSADISTTGKINFLNINDVYIRMNNEYYPVFATFANGNEPYGLDALKSIVNIDVSDSNDDRTGLYNLNYSFDTNGGFIIFTKIDDYAKSKCYLQYAPDKIHNLIDDLPDGEYFQIVTSGC